MDELNSSNSYIAINDSNVSASSITELIAFSTQQAARRNEEPPEVINLDETNVEDRLVNEYDRESDDEDNGGQIVYDTGDENEEENQEEDENHQNNESPENQNLESTRQGSNDNVQANQNDQEPQTNQNDVEEEEEEDDEFVNPRAKMPRLHSDLNLKASASVKEEPKKEESILEEETCSICFEPWTNAGEHRLVCLKCGHLFGESCIERWVKSNPKCPQCNVPNRKHDIRRIYARSVKCQDTAELEKALKDIETEKSLRKRAEIHASEIKLQLQNVSVELTMLSTKYKSLLLQLNSSNNGQSSIFSMPVNNLTEAITLNYKQDRMINITDTNGGCRTIAFSPRHAAILVSQPSNSPIFPGFGIKKINFLDYKVSQYIPIHSKLIRDLALNTTTDDGIILTCGLDKMIKMTHISSNTLIHSYTCQHPIWSCTYNLDNPIYFYAGLGNGHVLTFDKRKTDKNVDILNSEVHTGTPVCSLQYVPKNTDAIFKESGLIVTQLDRLSFFQFRENEEFIYNPLLLESNIMSCSFEPETRNILVSTRPSQKHPHVRHLVYGLSKPQDSESNSDDTCSLNLVHTYKGSNVQKMLAKTKLFMCNNELFGCAPDEASKSVVVWDVNKNVTCCKLPNQNDVLDICPIQYNQENFLCSLSDKQLSIFKQS